MTDQPPPPPAGGVAEDDHVDDELTLETLDRGLALLADRIDEVEQQSADRTDHRLDEVAGEFAEAMTTVAEKVLQLRRDVDELRKKAEAPLEPGFWHERATPYDWDQLIDWVDQLQATYGWIEEFEIYPCWPAHLGVVEELAGLYHSWRHAQIVDETNATPGSDKKIGSSDLAAWHDRWLWPLLQRVRSEHFRMITCRRGHEAVIQAPRPTDRSRVGTPTPPPAPAGRPGPDADLPTGPQPVVEPLPWGFPALPPADAEPAPWGYPPPPPADADSAPSAPPRGESTPPAAPRSWRAWGDVGN